jgi:superfamily II DNA/RNA helicase
MIMIKCMNLLKTRILNTNISFNMAVSIPTFNAYNIQNKSIFEALTHNNIHTPSSIQDIVIPSLLTSPSVSQNIFYIASQNGTGKTLSYLLPIIDILKS